MKKLLNIFALAATMAIPSAAQAQNFIGAGCTGDQFLFCGSWTGNISSNTLTLTFDNTSSHSNSSITQIWLGNITFSGVSSVTSSYGSWSLPNGNGNNNPFNGVGLLASFTGADAGGGINGGISPAENPVTLTFTFTGLSANVNTMQIGLHDQGVPTNQPNCQSSKGVLLANSLDQNTYTGNCGSTRVPEPSSYALLTAGLFGVFGVVARRRRTQA